MEPELRRLQRIEVDGLFGIYDHSIDLNTTDRVTLLHGPNGVGKRTALQMVNALMRNNMAYFGRIPFTRFRLGFMDGSTLELKATGAKGEKSGKLTLRTDGTPAHTRDVSLATSEAETLAERVDFLKPHDSLANTWIDIRDDEVLTESDVLMRFGRRLAGPNRSRQRDPTWLSSFLEKANVHLIEAQRLVSAHWDPKLLRDYGYPRHRPPPLISSVVECGRDFQQRLGETMANYGRQAQTLDQTFPQRLIAATDELDVAELQERLTAVDNKTEEFKAIGILDESSAPPFDVNSLRNLDNTQARVMTVYVQDIEGKLRALDDLARRARLLLDNVNEKYEHKKIRLDQQDGLVAESEDMQLVPLDALSSGEQHELVLLYDLLFRVRPNTVVLVDEPELSLHVAWQKKFLPDLIDIVKLSGFDAVVATHSPFIVGDRDDLMVGLGDQA